MSEPGHIEIGAIRSRARVLRNRVRVPLPERPAAVDSSGSPEPDLSMPREDERDQAEHEGEDQP